MGRPTAPDVRGPHRERDHRGASGRDPISPGGVLAARYHSYRSARRTKSRLCRVSLARSVPTKPAGADPGGRPTFRGAQDSISGVALRYRYQPTPVPGPPAGPRTHGADRSPRSIRSAPRSRLAAAPSTLTGRTRGFDRPDRSVPRAPPSLSTSPADRCLPLGRSPRGPHRGHGHEGIRTAAGRPERRPPRRAARALAWTAPSSPDARGAQLPLEVEAPRGVIGRADGLRCLMWRRGPGGCPT
jgi:hypothetical protein